MGVIATNGYDGASLDQISEAAGVSKAVIYDHFPSKHGLHSALLEKQTVELLSYVAGRVIGAGSDPLAQLRAGMDAFFEFVESHPFAWRMIFRDPPADKALIKLHRQVQDQATDAIAALLAAAAPDFILGDERRLRMGAEALKWQTNGLAAWWYEHREVPRSEVVAVALDLSWLGLERLAGGERLEIEEESS